MQKSQNKKSKAPRRIMAIKPSKYEATEAVHANKKYWNNVFDLMDSNRKKPMKTKEVDILSEALPDELCDKVCNILGIDGPCHTSKRNDDKTEKSQRKLCKAPLLSYRKTILIDRDMDSDTDVEVCTSDEDQPNIHHEFLGKSEREQITWATRYLQPEREDEKSLVKKADDLTNKIAEEFCEYMKQLGGDQQSQLFTPKAIKELFQIEFDTHVARSLQVIPKELPTVNERIANVTNNPDKSNHAALSREITKDIKAEAHPDCLRAFGRSLPRQDQWRAPRNDTKDLWRSARHVPKDLVTLKTVWEGITNLRSVKEYCRWMIEHPEYRRAPYLSNLGMFDRAVLDARLTFELENTVPGTACLADNEPESVESIRHRLSELSDMNQSS